MFRTNWLHKLFPTVFSLAQEYPIIPFKILPKKPPEAP
jgi:hypothetical protein